MTDIATLREIAKTLKPAIAVPVLAPADTILVPQLSKQAKPHWNPGDAQAPFVTTGEIGMDSRGYSITRASKAFCTNDWSQAKLERHVHEVLLAKNYPCDGGVLVPLDSRQLAMEQPEFMAMDLPALISKGVSGSDPDQLKWMYKRYALAKVLGETPESGAGFLVQPEQATEMIDVLRDRSLLGRTTIQEIELPRSGRLPLNKTTTDVEWQYVAENTDLSSLGLIDPAVGQVNLIAKTAVGLAQLSNQLIQDSTPSAEQWVRRLYGVSMAADVNNAIINGTGSNGQPRGIANHPDKTVRIAGTTGANGDTLDPEDIALAVADVGEVDGDFEGWIMRPAMVSAIRNKRADAVSANDGKGHWLFVEGNGANPATLQGFPIAESTKVSNTRTKGAGTTLTYMIGGMLSQIVYGRMATLELRSSDVAGTAFQTNQTWIRAVRRDDVAIRIAAAIVFIDSLLQV